MTGKRADFLGIHPQFHVTDVVETAEYYRDILGFAIQEYFGDPPVFTQVERGRASIQLGKASCPDRVTPAHGDVGYNTYVWVDDVEKLAQEYRQSGADIMEGPVDRTYLCRELVVRDCNGLVLCFGQSTSKATASQVGDEQ